ncbi:MAG: hypothetical protein PVI35_01065 [Acidimicrobiia bacterium]
MGKMWRLVWVLALLTTGCRAEVNLVLDVNEDGSSTVEAEVGVDQEVQDLVGSLANGDLDILTGLDFGIEGTTEQRTEGDMTFYVTPASFDSVAALIGAVGDGDGTGPFRRFSLTVNDDGAELDATLAPLGGSDLAADELPLDPATISGQLFSASVLVTLPGTVEEHNADEQLADGRLRWAIPITGDELTLHARSSYGGRGFPVWLAAVLALAAAAGIALWAVSARRKRRAIAAIGAAPAPPPSPFFEIDDRPDD